MHTSTLEKPTVLGTTISNDAAFSQELRKKFQEFTSNETKNIKGGLPLILKSVVYLSLVGFFYTSVIFFDLSWPLLIASACSLGFFIALSGINIAHDGVHDSFSSKQWMNNLASFVLNVLGASSYYWKTKHTVSHHNFTNIHEKDEDLDQGALLRLHPEQKKRGIHRFQHVYFPFLYSLAYLTWTLYFDFAKYFSGKGGNFSFDRMKLKDHVIFWVGKISAISLFLITPLLVLGTAKGLTVFFSMAVVCGITLSVIFQLAHIIEGVNFINPDESKKENWFVHQIKTTANFSVKSKLVYFICGGLNFQVEHHLFPAVSHVHYPRLSKMVEDTCKKFNIEYNSYPTFVQAMKSHVFQLKKLGVA